MAHSTEIERKVVEHFRVTYDEGDEEDRFFALHEAQAWQARMGGTITRRTVTTTVTRSEWKPVFPPEKTG